MTDTHDDITRDGEELLDTSLDSGLDEALSTDLSSELDEFESGLVDDLDSLDDDLGGDLEDLDELESEDILDEDLSSSGDFDLDETSDIDEEEGLDEEEEYEEEHEEEHEEEEEEETETSTSAQSPISRILGNKTSLGMTAAVIVAVGALGGGLYMRLGGSSQQGAQVADFGEQLPSMPPMTASAPEVTGLGLTDSGLPKMPALSQPTMGQAHQAPAVDSEGWGDPGTESASPQVAVTPSMQGTHVTRQVSEQTQQPANDAPLEKTAIDSDEIASLVVAIDELRDIVAGSGARVDEIGKRLDLLAVRYEQLARTVEQRNSSFDELRKELTTQLENAVKQLSENTTTSSSSTSKPEPLSGVTEADQLAAAVGMNGAKPATATQSEHFKDVLEGRERLQAINVVATSPDGTQAVIKAPSGKPYILFEGEQFHIPGRVATVTEILNSGSLVLASDKHGGRWYIDSVREPRTNQTYARLAPKKESTKAVASKPQAPAAANNHASEPVAKAASRPVALGPLADVTDGSILQGWTWHAVFSGGFLVRDPEGEFHRLRKGLHYKGYGVVDGIDDAGYLHIGPYRVIKAAP